MLKKWLSLALVLIIMITAVPVVGIAPAVSAASPAATVSTHKTGGTVAVTVTLLPVKSLACCIVSVQFDPAVVSIPVYDEGYAATHIVEGEVEPEPYFIGMHAGGYQVNTDNIVKDAFISTDGVTKTAATPFAEFVFTVKDITAANTGFKVVLEEFEDADAIIEKGKGVTIFNGSVDVTFVPVSSVTLNNATASIAIDATKQLTATVSPSDATNKAVTWSSSNTSVATVSDSGLVTAKAVGNATITCKTQDGGKTATCEVTVLPQTPTSVEATSISYNSIKISWAAVTGTTAYEVWRAVSKEGPYTRLVSTEEVSYTDSNVTAGATYHYKIRAYKTMNAINVYGDFSIIVSAMTLTLNSIQVKTVPVKTSYFVGDTLDATGLTLTATYSNGTTQIIDSGFTCSPMKLSTIGTQKITVTYQGKTTTFTITVKAVPVNSVKLDATSASVAIGATKQLTAMVSPSNAATKAVTWSSSNTAVATVSASGLVTAKAAGKATITCKAADGSGKTATCTITVIPKTPTGVKAASASYNSIKISWTALSDATGYAVYRATSKTGTYDYLKSTTSTSLTDTSRTTGTTYYYKVRAYKTVGETKYLSGCSAIVSAKAVPAVPSSFTAAKASATSVKTTWKAVTGASGYEVWMATSSGGTYSKLITTTKTTYTKTKLTKNKTYYFKVRAYKTVGNTKVYGAFTAIKSAKPS